MPKSIEEEAMKGSSSPRSRFPLKNARRTKPANEAGKDTGPWGVKKLWKKSTNNNALSKKGSTPSNLSRQLAIQANKETSATMVELADAKNPSSPDQVVNDSTDDLKVLLGELYKVEEAVAKVDQAEKKLLALIIARMGSRDISPSLDPQDSGVPEDYTPHVNEEDAQSIESMAR